MDAIIPLVVLVVVGYFVYLYLTSNRQQPHAAPRALRDEHDPFADAQRVMQSAMDTCNAGHANAVQALLWLASSDGTVSKQEARNVFRFCEKQGSMLPAGLADALEHLNNGMSIRSSRTDSAVQNDLAEIAKRPIQYRAAFLGAAHAICGGNKRISKTKQDFLDRATKIVEEQPT